MRTSGHWFGPAERPLLGWLTVPEQGAGATGVLLLPPVGYQYWSVHGTLRALAERLASSGHVALRIDYDGTGDSAGDQWDPDRLSAWRASASAGAAELRGLGCGELIVAGARLGAALALLDGRELGASAVVAWAPVTSGRRYAKEIRLLSTAVPEDRDPAGEGTVVSAGAVFRAQTLTDLSGLTAAAKAATAPSARVLLIGDAGYPAVAAHLRSLGSEVEDLAIAGGETALEAPTEEATVPEGIVAAIDAWIGPSGPTPPREPPAPRTFATIQWQGASLTEEVVALGPDRLVGVLTEPERAGQPESRTAARATVVFLNTGSEPHLGPGRAWVEYARSLAVLGHRSLRADFRGWGESPSGGFAPGRPYDAHCQEDTVALVRALRERGHERIVLLGLCASAWTALRVVRHEPVDGVIALNPQLYWRPGDPVEATMAETRLRRTAEREREARGCRYRVWTGLDLAGHRPWAGRWLDELVAGGIPIAMVFAAGDDGLEYLRNRLGRRLGRALRSGSISVTEIPDIDHSMHRAWLRDAVVAAVDEWLSDQIARR